MISVVKPMLGGYHLLVSVANVKHTRKFFPTV